MKALLKGGPHDGQYVECPLPLTREIRTPVPMPVDLLNPFKPRWSPKIACYTFAGTAVIDDMGEIQWAIYFHTVTEEA